MAHLCHAEGCQAEVPPKLLMCFRHWRMVSRDFQRAIWRTYRKGQEVDKRPSAVYLAVQAMAVADVAVREGRWTSDQATDHVMARVELVSSRLTLADLDFLRGLVGV